MQDFWKDAEVISAYSRTLAIEDGVLINLTEWAQECGFKVPVACTERVWGEIVEMDERAKKNGESEKGRAKDMLMNLVRAARTDSGDRVDFKTCASKNGRIAAHDLYALCGPGDRGEPVITIMFLDED